MDFTFPMPLPKAVDQLRSLDLMPTHLDTEGLKTVDAELRQRSFFSAKVFQVGTLQRLLNLTDKHINVLHGIDEGTEVSRHKSMQNARLDMRDYLDSISYEAPEGKVGTIEDLRSDARLNLIIDQNAASMRGAGYEREGNEPSILYAFPCVELKRVAWRRVPRGTDEGIPDQYWQERWVELGGQLYDGRMICRKDDPIREQISDFDQPYGPPGFNSGYDWEEVSRAESEDLGVIQPGEEVDPSDVSVNMPEIPSMIGEALEGIIDEAIHEYVGA